MAISLVLHLTEELGAALLVTHIPINAAAGVP
jgi:hypothetical protein